MDRGQSLQRLRRGQAPRVERALDFTATSYPFAWCSHAAAEARQIFGEDFFPYGLEANRKTLDAFLQYAFEHGVCHRRVTPDELFPKRADEDI